ncbi:MAG: homocysteine S-methyltransferase family protein [Acidimicrobiales bacterium]
MVMPPVQLTDSGLETWLVFQRGVELADFAAFPLLGDNRGRALLTEYFRDHLRIAARAASGFVLETPTWRASTDWGARLGYDDEALDRVNRDAVDFVRSLGNEFPSVEVIVSGNVGPRGDGYQPDHLLAPGDASSYHRAQIESFAAAGADRVTMLTATHPGEAIGVVRAAVAVGLPVVISFTVETDGRLPVGRSLDEAITEVDAATDGAADFFGINCAHPGHFASALDGDPIAIGRLGLLRANASRLSHDALNEASELDDGDPAELAGQYEQLVRDHPHFRVLGGCCGTDARHIDAIARACLLS